jgi:hypothetical protein
MGVLPSPPTITISSPSMQPNSANKVKSDSQKYYKNCPMKEGILFNKIK